MESVRDGQYDADSRSPGTPARLPRHRSSTKGAMSDSRFQAGSPDPESQACRPGPPPPRAEFTRKKAFVDSIRRYVVLIDGVNRGTISNGGTLELTLEPGERTVQLKIDWCRSNPITLTVNDGDELHFQCGPNLEGVGLLLGFYMVLFAPGRYLFLRRAGNE